VRSDGLVRVMRLLFIGASNSALVEPGMPLERKLKITGHNTGNLLIGQSLLEELRYDACAFGMRLRPEEVNERFDVIVIAAANFIYKGFDMSAVASFIEATRLPCFIAGLGAQAPSVRAAIGELQQGTRRLLSILQERCRLIGVRGDFTAQVLNDFGITNVAPVGCPSLYRRLTPSLSVRRPTASTLHKISLNGSRNVVDHAGSPAAARHVEAQLIRLSLERGYDYVLQNEDPEMYVLCGSDSEQHMQAVDSVIETFDLGVTRDELVRHVRAKYRLFFNLAEWDDYIRDFDLSAGSRFHGNLIALTNGVPALIFPHDSRTTELAELMQIPHVPVEQVDTIDLETLVSTADYDAFELRYRELYGRFAAFLSENGLAHRLRH
jgi:hypothetical protein